MFRAKCGRHWISSWTAAHRVGAGQERIRGLSLYVLRTLTTHCTAPPLSLRPKDQLTSPFETRMSSIPWVQNSV